MSELFGYPAFDENGVRELTKRTGMHKDMMMDIMVYQLKSGEEKLFESEIDERAFLLLEGSIEFCYDGNSYAASRKNVFEDGMYCMHVSRGVSVTIKAKTEAKVLCQATENDRIFDSRIYTPSDCSDVTSGKGLCDNTAVRLVRTAFDYNNAPFSNMVLGEVITNQGNWSSYIPHHHPQPEVYYYLFDKPQGFGAAFVGDDVFKIKDGSFSAIPGGKTHPQVTAPGYRMYVCWMIRHFEGQPWTDRIDDEEHVWLYDWRP